MSFATLIHLCELLSVSSDYILMSKKEALPIDDTIMLFFSNTDVKIKNIGERQK